MASTGMAMTRIGTRRPTRSGKPRRPLATCIQIAVESYARSLWGNQPKNAYGRRVAQLYGPGAEVIDTNEPFTVVVKTEDDATVRLSLEQHGRAVDFFNSSSAGNPWYPHPSGVPADASAKLKHGFDHGMVLSLSIWADDSV